MFKWGIGGVIKKNADQKKKLDLAPGLGVYVLRLDKFRLMGNKLGEPPKVVASKKARSTRGSRLEPGRFWPELLALNQILSI